MGSFASCLEEMNIEEMWMGRGLLRDEDTQAGGDPRSPGEVATARIESMAGTHQDIFHSVMSPHTLVCQVLGFPPAREDRPDCFSLAGLAACIPLALGGV